MRLIERDKRAVYLRVKGTDADNPYGEPIPVWGEPVKIRACVQPVSGRLEATVSGQRVNAMHIMLYEGDAAFAEGDGVCMDVVPDGQPDYHIISVQQWQGHRRIQIERIALGGAP